MAATTYILLEPPALLVAKARAPAGWVDIRRPLPAFAMSGGLFGETPAAYLARRHSDGSRIDNLRFGDLASARQGKGIWMHLKIYRMAREPAPNPAFYVQMARLAADDGLAVRRSSVPDLVATRLGGFAVSDLMLTGAMDERDRLPACMGYRLAVERPALEISGILCGSSDHTVDRRRLACIIDRLDVFSARDDVELSRFFARSELKWDKPCGVRSQAGMRNRAIWIDQASAKDAIGALRLRPVRERQTRL